MTTDHEEVQELLAAYAMCALEAEENQRAERLIASHVPDCQECREALRGFTAVSGELALAAGSRRPPRVLAARLRRQARSSRPRRRAWAILSAAALLSLIALAGWSAHLSTRVNDAEARQARTGEFLATVSHPLSHVVPLSGARSTSRGAAYAQLAAAYVPGSGSLYLFGSLPAPARDRVYQVWVLRDGRFQSAGTFRPEGGQVLYRIQADVERIQELLVTEEPVEGSTSPSAERVVTASL
jgi:anti-sigma-K factor RskA